MSLTTIQVGTEEVDGHRRTFDEREKTLILRELDAILNSPVFQPRKRGKQFLSYVVRHRLEGNQDRLKERTIGVDLFKRPAGYATGDDPVVRVQAGEVRRRLDQYYQLNPNNSELRIELHPGSYTPEIKWIRPEPRMGHHPSHQPMPESPETPQQMGLGHESPRVGSSLSANAENASRKHKGLLWGLAAGGFVLFAGLVVLIESNNYQTKAGQSVQLKFWAPALSSPESVLICLAKPTVYVPSVKLYQRHSKTPEEFLGQFARLSQRPGLQPDDKLSWSDMVEYPDYGLASGDVYTAIQLSGRFGQLGKKNQVRIGGDYSFEDLRSSPSVVIGAFNNRWTIQMTSNLHFAFADEGDQSIIREVGQSGRKWYTKTDSSGKAAEDYAIVTRLRNSTTGQFVVIVAGIRSYGTQAAGDFVSNPEYLQAGLKTASPGWEERNMQIVLQTQVTDGLPYPPQVVAIYVW